MTKAKPNPDGSPKKRGRKSGAAINGPAIQMRARFVQEYPKDFNGFKAAVRAGYSERSARTAASRLLADPAIQAEMAAITGKSLAKLEITRERVLNEIARVAFFSMGDILHITEDGDPFIDLSKAGPDEMAALASAEVHDYTEGRGDDQRNVRKVVVKPHDKLGALDKLAKHLGLLKEKIELTGADGEPLALMDETAMAARLAAILQAAAARRDAGK